MSIKSRLKALEKAQRAIVVDWRDTPGLIDFSGYSDDELEAWYQNYLTAHPEISDDSWTVGLSDQEISNRYMQAMIGPSR
jgi:hypothetical protein